MDRTNSGKVSVNGLDLIHTSKRQMTDCRRTGTGFVLKSHSLVPNVMALEDVDLTQVTGGLNAGVTLEEGLGRVSWDAPP